MADQFSFQKSQSRPLRIWHWLNAIVIFGLLGTVLLRKTLLSWRTNSQLIETKLGEAGLAVTPDLAREIAVAIRNPLWDLHIYLGYALAGLWLGRALVVLLVEKSCPGIEAFKALTKARRSVGEERKGLFHYALVHFSYGLFYLATLLMVVSGLILTFKNELGVAKETAGMIKENHETLMWFFVLFVGGHLAGVIMAELGKYPGIVSNMINGGRR